MKLIKPLSVLALVYCIIGPILLFIERSWEGTEALHQALPITLLAVFFFIYSFLSLALFHRLLSKNSKALTSYYLAGKTLRLLLSIIIITGYGILIREGLLIFAINLFIYYIVTAIFSSIYCIKEENKTKTRKQNNE